MSLPPLAANAWLRWDVVSRLLPPQARTVLEIGCGGGAMGTRIAATRDYLGVEPDATSYAAAAGRLAALGRGEVRHGRVEDVVEPGRTFDLLCSFEVIEHLEDDLGALKEWTRWVRPGGWVLLSTPAFASRYGAWDTVVGHYRRYDPQTFEELLRAAGLEVVSNVVYGAGLGEVLERARNLIGARRLKAADATLAAAAASEGGSSDKDAAMAELTSASGRLLQPPAAAGLAVQAVTAPFRVVQRRFPARGTGLVTLARLPE